MRISGMYPASGSRHIYDDTMSEVVNVCISLCGGLCAIVLYSTQMESRNTLSTNCLQSSHTHTHTHTQNHNPPPHMP
jgi:hypothetical protein